MSVKHIILTLIASVAITGLYEIHAQDKATGKASYYSHRLHGRRTSDGSLYHRDSLTCAHRTLPFGTLLKVRNTQNGREVVVKVTDRGPFCKGRVVDLSYAAAEKIGILRAGVAPVEIETVGKAAPASPLAPNDPTNGNILPELQLLDPATGNYYTMTEWLQRGKEEQARAKANAARQQRQSYIAKKQPTVPRWQVVNGKTTARAAAKKK